MRGKTLRPRTKTKQDEKGKGKETYDKLSEEGRKVEGMGTNTGTTRFLFGTVP
jgi:hypothetical protein